MISQRIVVASLLVSIACAAAISHAPSDSQVLSEDEVVLLSPRVKALPLLVDIYLSSGFTSEQAAAIAKQKLGMPFDDDIDIPTSSPDHILMSPKANTLALFNDEFLLSGWSEENAIKHARQVLGLPAEPEGVECVVYPVRMVWCEGGNKIATRGFLNARCWDDPDGDPQTQDGLDLCAMCLCPGTHKWLSLTTQTLLPAGCGALPSGTCASVHISGAPFSVPCNEVDVDCSCFNETSPTVNCNDIECCCCSSKTTGCAGCPSCSGCP